MLPVATQNEARVISLLSGRIRQLNIRHAVRVFTTKPVIYILYTTIIRGLRPASLAFFWLDFM